MDFPPTNSKRHRKDAKVQKGNGKFRLFRSRLQSELNPRAWRVNCHRKPRSMRRVVVAELVLLAVGLLLAAALLLQCCLGRGTTSHKRRAPPSSSELPLSRPTTDKQSRLLLLLMLCSGRRRARVEPAAPANSVEESPVAAEVDDVARWRERWFGSASRALYTIDEVDEECPTEDGGDVDEEKPEPETPFYTPPASPSRLA